MVRKESIFVSFIILCLLISTNVQSTNLALATSPIFLSESAPPLTMLVMGRDHKMFYEAYNDSSDLNADGVLDIGYKGYKDNLVLNPTPIDYFGYFDSYKCYNYSSGNSRFEAVSVTANKKCKSGGNQYWSGDFLNYLTTTRIDAMRKVLYGGTRSTDSEGGTVLERALIPQDAHSWGKEYASVVHDGYDISDYTPLSLPARTGLRHLFASTTIHEDPSNPLLRVLNDTEFRVWQWVSKEGRAASSSCANGPSFSSTSCAKAAQAVNWEIVPSEVFSNLKVKAWSTGDPRYPGSPNDHRQFRLMKRDYGIPGNSFLSGGNNKIPMSNIDGAGNPFGNGYTPYVYNHVDNEHYFLQFTGKINIPSDGNYTFAVDGDDAVEFMIDGKSLADVVAHWYGPHARGNGNVNTLNNHSGTIYLTAGLHNITFRMHEHGGGDYYHLYWQTGSSPESAITDYSVRVKVCNTGLLEENCQLYASGHYKPTGLLQKYGENDTMLFGLLSGSYDNNMQGGVLRKKVSSMTNEINLVTGQINNNDGRVNGIIDSINRFKIVEYGGGSYSNCGWITNGPMTNGRCRSWGNPIAEMQYETLRYFAGKGAPTPEFKITNSNFDNYYAGLIHAPDEDWADPYTNNLECSKPFSLIVSDINPSYDTDQLPGSHFSNFSGDVAGLNVSSLGDDIWATEFGANQNIFIGQSGVNDDSNPTAKTVTSFGDIRGLAPEEPSKQGGYYAASVAYYGFKNDINSTKSGDQNMQTFAVALASPLPRIEIPVNGHVITLVPFGKSVFWSGNTNISPDEGDFQPTNTIVDFYVETITDSYGKFRINYEDVEQGADHDMDAIVIYEYQVNDDNDAVTITLTSEYASGGIIQHLGYVISGTNNDGSYLLVRDSDNISVDADYYLDRPSHDDADPTTNHPLSSNLMPLVDTRTFTPGTTNGATLLKDPLWYAAKWGGFIDADNDNIPEGEEWDRNHDGTPDNYFLVTNALHLEDQLSAAFDEILARTSSAASVSLNSISLNSSSRLYQVRFNSKTWSGQVLSFPIESDGGIDYSGSSTGGAEWDAATILEAQDPDAGRVIITQNGTRGIPFRWPSDHTSPGVSELNSTQTTALLVSRPYAAVADNDQAYGETLIDYLRGDHTHEGPGRFRSRSTPLGDLIHSAPYYVAAPPYNYPDNIEAVAYSSFRSQEAIRNRRHMIYTGANDGMLHGFDAGTGAEKLAFVPNAVYSQLNKLAGSSYNDNHQYYVDGSPIVVDAFFNNGDNAWHTVLASGLRGGGKSVFALDVTNPVTFSESNANDLFLWEYTDSADLGYTYGQVAIAPMRNGTWAAIFGNGYNSSNGHSVLYLVDIATGNLIKKIDTGRGAADDPTGESRPNGMATPAPVDIDGDRRVDFIYAGDLHGHMWKIDVRGSNSSDWAVAYTRDNDNAPIPLFTTESDQAITTRPEVSAHSEGGYVINFGTGKYLEENDKISTGEATQAFYGIWDRDVRNNIFKAFSQDDLFEHEIILETNEFGYDLRVTTDNDEYDWHENDNSIPSDESGGTYLGWYMDLVNTRVAPLNNQGEKQVTNPILRHGRIVFSTLVPNADACRFGGTSWLMEMDAQTGSRLEETPFDLNDDGGFTTADFVTVIIDGVEVSVPVSGKKSKVGITETPGVLKSGGQAEYKYSSGTGSSDATVNPNLIEVTTENGGKNGSGRQSWRQLQ